MTEPRGVGCKEGPEDEKEGGSAASGESFPGGGRGRANAPLRIQILRDLERSVVLI